MMKSFGVKKKKKNEKRQKWENSKWKETINNIFI